MSKGVSEIETVPAKRASDGAQMRGAIPFGLDKTTLTVERFQRAATEVVRSMVMLSWKG